MRIPSGVTDQYIYFIAVDSTDLKTRETGLTSFTVYRSRNGAAAAAMTTPTVTEVDATNMPGVYQLLLDEDMTIGTGNDSEEMVFHITQAAMAPVTRVIELYRPKITAGYTLGVGSDGDLLEVNTLTGHTAQTGDSYARLGAPAGASISADIATVDTVVDGIQTDLSNGTDGLGAIKTAVDAVPTAAANADAVWDEAQIDHVGAGTFGEVATEVASILTDTGTTLPATLTTIEGKVDTVDTVVDGIQTDLSNGTDGLGAIKTAVDAVPTATENADALLNRDMSAVSDTTSRSPLNALRFLRNKWSISGSTLTVTKEDDATSAWTSTLTSDAGADPVTGSDPA